MIGLRSFREVPQDREHVAMQSRSKVHYIFRGNNFKDNALSSDYNDKERMKNLD